MHSREIQYRLKRLQLEDATWALLRADDAGLIIAFFAALFESESEIDISHARVRLENEMLRWLEAGLKKPVQNINAQRYLTEWIHKGWLRELDGKLTLSDAAQKAINFTKQLDYRERTTTASHLALVQGIVSKLALSLTRDIQTRKKMLEEEIKHIQSSLNELEAGIIKEPSEQEHREQIREVLQQARGLTYDFRYLESDIEDNDHKLRTKMVDAHHRGEVVKEFLDLEDQLAHTDAGQAFSSFYSLLSNPLRTGEFEQQIKDILTHTPDTILTGPDRQFLNRLTRELRKESRHVMDKRGRTYQNLRHFVESGVYRDKRRIDHLIQELKNIAIHFKETDLKTTRSVGLTITTGRVRLNNYPHRPPRLPNENIDLSTIKTHRNDDSLAEHELNRFEGINIIQVAHQLRDILNTEGPMSLAQLTRFRPVNRGLEELIALIRIAQSINATELKGKEEIMFGDTEGYILLGKIPTYFLSHDMFPKQIEELGL